MNSPRPSSAERRAQLLDAADAVFAEHGVTAALDLVVERAQVGRATLYRQFPDRRAIPNARNRLDYIASSLSTNPNKSQTKYGCITPRISQ